MHFLQKNLIKSTIFCKKNGFDAGGRAANCRGSCGYEQLIFEGEIELVLIPVWYQKNGTVPGFFCLLRQYLLHPFNYSVMDFVVYVRRVFFLHICSEFF